MSGVFVRRFVTYGALNAPWAMIKINKNRIAIGNFGSGIINLYNVCGEYRGTIDCEYDRGKNIRNNAIKIDGLWGLVNINDDIYFASGPNNESDGLYGVLIKKYESTQCNRCESNDNYMINFKNCKCDEC